MKTPSHQEVDILRQQGKTFQEIADIYGCSRQNVHQIANRKPKIKQQNTKMKAPTKSELYAQVEALTKANIELQERLEAEEKERWFKNKDRAFSRCYDLVPFAPRDIYGLTLEHIDKSGYWFSFELINDDTRQTYCVRHTDL